MSLPGIIDAFQVICYVPAVRGAFGDFTTPWTVSFAGLQLKTLLPRESISTSTRIAGDILSSSQIIDVLSAITSLLH